MVIAGVPWLWPTRYQQSGTGKRKRISAFFIGGPSRKIRVIMSKSSTFLGVYTGAFEKHNAFDLFFKCFPGAFQELGFS